MYGSRLRSARSASTAAEPRLEDHVDNREFWDCHSSLTTEHVVVRGYATAELRVHIVLGAVVLHLKYVEVYRLVRCRKPVCLETAHDELLLRVASQKEALAVFFDHQHQRCDVGSGHALEGRDAVPARQIE